MGGRERESLRKAVRPAQHIGTAEAKEKVEKDPWLRVSICTMGILLLPTWQVSCEVLLREDEVSSTVPGVQ